MIVETFAGKTCLCGPRWGGNLNLPTLGEVPPQFQQEECCDHVQDLHFSQVAGPWTWAIGAKALSLMCENNSGQYIVKAYKFHCRLFSGAAVWHGTITKQNALVKYEAVAMHIYTRAHWVALRWGSPADLMPGAPNFSACTCPVRTLLGSIPWN